MKKDWSLHDRGSQFPILQEAAGTHIQFPGTSGVTKTSRFVVCEQPHTGINLFRGRFATGHFVYELAPIIVLTCAVAWSLPRFARKYLLGGIRLRTTDPPTQSNTDVDAASNTTQRIVEDFQASSGRGTSRVYARNTRVVALHSIPFSTPAHHRIIARNVRASI
jgi:hypothetical protein